MEKPHKVLYETPSTLVFEVKTEGVICQSGGMQNYDWNNPSQE